MSPRVFKLGLALFLVMSGLFGAKLSMLGAKGSRTSWFSGPSGGETAALPETEPGSASAAGRSRSDEPVPPRASAEIAALEAESLAHSAPPLSESDKALVAAIKLELKSRGYGVGESPAELDLQARAAIIAFEADHHLRLTGEASEPLLHRLLLGGTGNEAQASVPPAPRAEKVIRSVQAALRRAGHPQLGVDGRMSPETTEAIRAFERSQGMKATGRVSGELVAKLRPVARDMAAH
jgi:hypothetical protein